MLINSLRTLSPNNTNTLLSISLPNCTSSPSSPLLSPTTQCTHSHGRPSKGVATIATRKRCRGGRILCGLLPLHPWASSIDPQSVTNVLFALSLFPYLGFLYFISRVESAPKLTLFGFHFLLVFVGATIPVGIYEKVQYGASLSNVDWLHGAAESLLALSNLFVVLGLRKALRNSED